MSVTLGISTLGSPASLLAQFKENNKDQLWHADYDVQNLLSKEALLLEIRNTYEMKHEVITQAEPLQSLLVRLSVEGWVSGGLCGLLMYWECCGGDLPNGRYLSPMQYGEKKKVSVLFKEAGHPMKQERVGNYRLWLAIKAMTKEFTTDLFGQPDHTGDFLVIFRKKNEI